MISFWHIEYFETGARTPYLTEMVVGVSQRDAAVALFSRLDCDDVLRINHLQLRVPFLRCLDRLKKSVNGAKKRIIDALVSY
jgi:hypothetical protein